MELRQGRANRTVLEANHHRVRHVFYQLCYGSQVVGRYEADGTAMASDSMVNKRKKAVEKPVAARPWKSLRDSHFPTATTAAGD